MTERIVTGFENKTLEEVIQSALYTDDNLFGEIRWAAEVKLHRRVPIPAWAKKHELPFLAKQAFQGAEQPDELQNSKVSTTTHQGS